MTVSCYTLQLKRHEFIFSFTFLFLKAKRLDFLAIEGWLTKAALPILKHLGNRKNLNLNKFGNVASSQKKNPFRINMPLCK